VSGMRLASAQRECGVHDARSIAGVEKKRNAVTSALHELGLRGLRPSLLRSCAAHGAASDRGQLPPDVTVCLAG
jgi:hypothetical protein